jgi:transcriptional regulator with XRE-family HTH domain
VRELRRERRLSQEQLAERAGLHRNYIGGIERGERNVALLNIGRFASSLGVSLPGLFEGIEFSVRRSQSS